MVSIKKHNGTTWDDAKVRKLTTSTDTITTLPADIYADGNNATVGLKGNMSQSGTPAPDSPIMPEGTGERTGNLFDEAATDTSNGYIDGAYLVSTGSPTSSSAYFVSEYISVTSGMSYTLRYSNRALNSPSYCLYDSTKNYVDGYRYNNVNPITFTIPDGVSFIRFSAPKNNKGDIMLNLGSTALPYAPYGYFLPITSAGQTTPVYLGEVESTRSVRRLVLTGGEDWFTYSADYPSHFITYAISNRRRGITPYCTHYVGSTVTDYSGLRNAQISVNTSPSSDERPRTTICDNRFLTIDDFKSYLAQQYAADTPVTVWYVLAEPTTGIVNEPVRKIGNYADTVSGIIIPTITGADSFDVETTLKPSEVSLGYTGWHDAEVKEWDGSQWQ